MLFYMNASVAEWSIAIDCKSIAFGLRRFESYPAHNLGRTDAKASIRPFVSRIFSGSNRSISGVSNFSPSLRTENQENKSIKSFLDFMVWFQPKLCKTSLFTLMFPFSKATPALCAKWTTFSVSYVQFLARSSTSDNFILSFCSSSSSSSFCVLYCSLVMVPSIRKPRMRSSFFWVSSTLLCFVS